MCERCQIAAPVQCQHDGRRACHVATFQIECNVQLLMPGLLHACTVANIMVLPDRPQLRCFTFGPRMSLFTHLASATARFDTTSMIGESATSTQGLITGIILHHHVRAVSARHTIAHSTLCAMMSSRRPALRRPLDQFTHGPSRHASCRPASAQHMFKHNIRPYRLQPAPSELAAIHPPFIQSCCVCWPRMPSCRAVLPRPWTGVRL